MGYARLRPELEITWEDTQLRDLEGNELGYTPKTEWVKSICVDSALGLYVLTEDDDYYFTCPSIDLEFSEQLKTA